MRRTHCSECWRTCALSTRYLNVPYSNAIFRLELIADHCGVCGNRQMPWQIHGTTFYITDKDNFTVFEATATKVTGSLLEELLRHVEDLNKKED